MTRTRPYIPFLLACLALLAAAPAGAKPAKRLPPAKVTVGHTVVGTSANGLASILVPVHYPLELKGRVAELRVALIDARGKTIRSWVMHERLNAGRTRAPDRRRRFVFVHRIGLDASLSRQLRQGASVRVLASGVADFDGDGKPESRSHDLATGRPLSKLRPKPVCSTIPHTRVKRGARVSLPLPVCDREMRWSVARAGIEGSARIRAGRLIYRAPGNFHGTDDVRLSAGGLRQFVPVTVGATSGIKVRAIGDSVTAGFGYYGETGGETMNFAEFLAFCIPAKKRMNDACSSNSTSSRSGEKAVEYAGDWGLSENISWAAQWANAHNVGDYQNLAISGSEPGDWAPKGQFYTTTKHMEAEEPDYVLLTLGANPLLSQLLTSPKNIWCADTSELPEFEACVRREFAKVGLRTNLEHIYSELLEHTKATIFVMQYHVSIPALAPEGSIKIALAGKMLNAEIQSVVAASGNSRLKLITPPHFNVGIKMKPVFPPGGGCAYEADGPSVQSRWTQDELEIYYGKEFCSPTPGTNPYWVIEGDSGIHPSAAGYTQMAAQVPAP